MELPLHLEETLAVVPWKDTVVAEDVQKKLKLETPNAASGRLADLYLLGLVTRRRDGKYWLYTRTANPNKRKAAK